MNDGDSFSEVCYDCFDRTKETAKRIVLWFPVFMLMAIAIYTYYVYVVAFSTNFLIYGNPSHKTRGALYIAFFNLMLVVFLACYFVTVFMSPGRPLDVEDLFIREPVEGEPFEPQKGEDGKIWLNSTVTRYCIKCSYVKSDRAHHCSVCDQCCLKMDHHCVWLNNCVGFRNYHMFMLTLWYGSVGAMFVAITLGQQLIYDAANKSLFMNEIQYLIATLFSFLLGASAAGLFFFHIRLISKNMTTIEHLDKQDAFSRQRRQRRARVATVTPVSKTSPFLLSPMMANFKAALGPKPWLWLVPFSYVPESRKGLYFPRISHEVPDNYSA